jgi:hypothetical protein
MMGNDDGCAGPADRHGIALLPDEPTAGKIVDEGSVGFARPELGHTARNELQRE